MQFLYNQDSGKQKVVIEGEQYKYLFKVRRHTKDEKFFFRNLKDKNLYKYQVETLDRRKAVLNLISYEEKLIEASKSLHLAWCIIDPKSIEKVIPFLNEIGVEKITFIYCEYSQYKYKPNFEKLEKLLLNSSGQCGRSSIIKLDQCNSLKEFLKQNPNSYMFNFSKNNIKEKKDDIQTIVIGCEGGFSKDEISMFSDEKTVGVDCSMILRSETAATAVATAVLL